MEGEVILEVDLEVEVLVEVEEEVEEEVVIEPDVEGRIDQIRLYVIQRTSLHFLAVSLS